jgi:hypothetical protein
MSLGYNRKNRTNSSSTRTVHTISIPATQTELNYIIRPHLISFIFPFVGMIPAIIYGAVSLWSGNETIKQPFSTFSNLSYISGAFGIFILSYISGKQIPTIVSVSGFFMITLGASSFIFHHNNTPENSWEEVVDKINMLLPFAFLSISAIYSMLCMNNDCIPSESNWFYFATILTSVVFMSLVIVFQEYITTEYFLITTGFVVALANLVVNILSENGEINKYSVINSLPWVSLQILYISTAFVILEKSTREKSLDLKKYDLSHGTWHYLTAVTLLGANLTIYRGITKDVYKTWKKELIFILHKFLFCILFLIFNYIEISSNEWGILWIVFLVSSIICLLLHGICVVKQEFFSFLKFLNSL